MDQSNVMPAAPPDEQGPIEVPNHFIIWLDQHIALETECILLKKSFVMAMNPTSGLYERNLTPDDIDESIRLDVPVLIELDRVKFMFQAFDNVEKCFETIEKNLTKRIFLITSGSKGKILIPSLVINFPNTFVSEYRMYVFCANMNMIAVAGAAPPTNAWALNFLDRILMFDHQDFLLARMVIDIAKYFFKMAGDLENSQDLHNARQYYHWSKQMYKRFETMDTHHQNMNTEINRIDQHINDIDRRLDQQRDDEGLGFEAQSD